MDILQELCLKNMTWSYSRLNSFESCPYGWYLKYLDDAESQPQFYSSYGVFIHKLLADFYTGKLQKDELMTKFLIDFSKEVKGTRPSPEIVSSYIEKGRNFFASFTPFPFKTLLVEHDAIFDFYGVPFRGIVDYVGELDGKIYLVDHKSRDLKPRSKRKKPTQMDKELDTRLTQLYIYSELIRQMFGRFPDYLCFDCFKVNLFIQEPFVDSAFEDAKKWVFDIIKDILDEKMFPPDPEFFKCRYLCDCFADCEYFALGVTH